MEKASLNKKMEKASLKLALLVVLLFIASGLRWGGEARELQPAQCRFGREIDCRDFCHGCYHNICFDGMCICGCKPPPEFELATDAIFKGVRFGSNCAHNSDCKDPCPPNCYDNCVEGQCVCECND